MTNSLITRCPKCSTAFRVTEDVLDMAKGKVRCGQCFHIFDALEAANKTPSTPKQNPPLENQPVEQEKTKTPSQPAPSKTPPLSNNEEPVNPEWLQTLFDEDDLSPGTPDDPLFDAPKEKSIKAPLGQSSEQKTPNTPLVDSPKPTQKAKTAESPSPAQSTQSPKPEPAPWEIELAEVEAALKTHKVTDKSEALNQALDSFASSHDGIKKNEPEAEQEPDYMVALHSLAQSASEQSLPTTQKQHAVLHGISAQEYLDPLIGEYEKEKKANKKPRTWLWFLGFLCGVFALFTQLTGHFFVQGSHSENFRVFYRVFCTYTGCTLPTFEDINAISIQHVRIQSHPTEPNALVVNAIMTNTSRYAQPMPKIALEFFDLNGAPVAARLFAPKNYLDKDFLDITYMPPNTPIHLVIPIRDPGARAVTHQLRVFPAETKSY